MHLKEHLACIYGRKAVGSVLESVPSELAATHPCRLPHLLKCGQSQVS